jgi:hypothetical protein
VIGPTGHPHIEAERRLTPALASVYTTRLVTVVVGVDDPGIWGDPLRDLVGVVVAGQPRADVEELADPRFARQVAERR